MIDCTFEHGHKAHLRHVVIDVLIIKENKLLLVKRSNKILEGNKWAMVGGFMEHGETLLETVQRETLEESGYKITDIHLLWINDNPNRPNEDKRGNVAFVFYATALQTTDKHDWEVQEVKWFPFDTLPEPELIAFDHMLSIQKYLDFKQGKAIEILG